jgi:osmoprotectant transport system substrate-binding protein
LAACLAIVLAACGSSGSSGGGANSTTPSGSGATIASTLVLGGAPECPQRPFCLIGLKKTYGLTFKSFKPLDAGGPLTVAALGQNKIQIGELFTTSGVIASKGWVLLQDDKKLQPADNVTPVLRNDIVAAYGKAMTDLVNGVSAKLTTEILTDLNKQTDIDQKDPEAVAKSWLESNNLIPASKVAAKSGPTIVVGSAKFTEDETLADVYADMLKANGYPVSKKLNIGSREIYFPALKNNQISFLPEYAGSLLTFLDPKKPATTNPATNAAQLAAVLKPLKLTALQPSTAEDVNGFVVTKSTADKYKLVNMSDLAKPAP